MQPILSKRIQKRSLLVKICNRTLLGTKSREVKALKSCLMRSPLFSSSTLLLERLVSRKRFDQNLVGHIATNDSSSCQESKVSSFPDCANVLATSKQGSKSTLDKPRHCLYSASALKVFSVFLTLFSFSYPFYCLRRSKSMIAFCASSGVLPI